MSFPDGLRSCAQTTDKRGTQHHLLDWMPFFEVPCNGRTVRDASSTRGIASAQPVALFFDTCSTPLDKGTFTAEFLSIIFTVKSDLNGLEGGSMRPCGCRANIVCI